jgi:hypothetical protein
LREKGEMPLERVVDLYLGNDAGAGKCARRAIGKSQGYEKVVDADESTLDGLAAGGGDRDGGGLRVGVGGPRRERPPETQVFWSSLGSAIRVAIAWRSPVAEWQDAHFESK